MDMRDKTIKALQKAIQCFERYSGDEYGREYNYARVEVEVLEDTVTLLKEDERAIQFQSDRLDALLKAREPVEPTKPDEDNAVYCGACGSAVGYEVLEPAGIDHIRYNYCTECGKPVKWK